MVKSDGSKDLAACEEEPLDPNKTGGIKSLEVNFSPSLLLNIPLALQVSFIQVL